MLRQVRKGDLTRSAVKAEVFRLLGAGLWMIAVGRDDSLVTQNASVGVMP